MATVAVTGGTGHLGGVLVHRLVELGHDVRVQSYKGQRGLIANLPVTFVEGEVNNTENMDQLLSGADHLYHLAAVISINGDMNGLVHQVNVDGAETAARAALKAGIGRMVHVSSCHAFDFSERNEVLVETRRRQIQPAPGVPIYNVSKAQGEARVREVVKEGLDVVIIHPTGIIGPQDEVPSPMGRFWLDLYHHRLPGLVKGAFDFVDVRDVAEGAVLAMEKGRTNESYLLSGTWQTIEDLAAVASDVTGAQIPKFVTPMWLARAVVPIQAGVSRAMGRNPLNTSEALHALYSLAGVSSAKAATELGFTSRPIQETVKDIYVWFRANDRLS